MLAVLELFLVAGAAALTAPSYDYDSSSPSSDYDDSPRPAPKLQASHGSSRPYKSSPSGYQFSSFRGPVSGSIEEIEVPFVQPEGATPYGDSRGAHPTTSFDYVAKPDYSFTYGMHDPESGVAQAQAEAREGDTVKGEYSVMEPDGTLRTVTYVADPVRGFQASVKYGPSGLPPPPPPTPAPTTGYTGPAAPDRAAPRHKPLPHRFKVSKASAPAPRPRPVYKSYEDYDD